MIIANWKMNGTRRSVATWIEAVSNNVNIKNINPCIFCPPTCYLEYAIRLINENGYQIEIGSQILNYCFEDESLTGGISTTKLKDLGVKYVLIGHSEQRNFLKEGISDASKNDLIFYSDNDEIPKLNDANLSTTTNKLIFFKQKLFYYKFNLLCDRYDWYGSKACKKKDLIDFEWLRNTKTKKYNFIDILFFVLHICFCL